jgi:uncharacterized protein (DUF1697 family)
MTAYLVILPGVNVSGQPRPTMADLEKSFRGLGHLQAVTYIQCGNVLSPAP